MASLIFPTLISLLLFALGFITGRLSKSWKRIGRFMINDNDPKKSAFWLEIDCDLDTIEKQDVIGFKVQHHIIPNNPPQ